MIVFVLRVISILILMIFIALCCQGIWWLIKPLLPKDLLSNNNQNLSLSLTVEPFLVVQEGKTQKDNSVPITRMVVARLSHIDEILTTGLTVSNEDYRIATEEVVPQQYYTEQTVSESIDIEFQAFKVDVIGVFNYIHNFFHKGDKLFGAVTLNENKIELLVTLETLEPRNVKGPWIVSTNDSDLNQAIEDISYQIAFDFHRVLNPQLEGLDYKQFQRFIQGLRNYQDYVRNTDKPDRSTEAKKYLSHAERIFKRLVDENLENTLIYSYMASILSLQGTSDAKKLITLLEKSIKLDGSNIYAKNHLAQLRSISETQPIELEDSLTLDELKTQPAFKTLGLNQISGGQHNVKVALLSTGIDPVTSKLGGRISDHKSFVDNEKESQDNNGHGTTVASLLVAIAPQADILSIKTLSNTGVGSISSIVDGVNYAIENGVDVLCLPLGSSGYSEIMKDVIEEANQAGILTISTAGNTPTGELIYPGAYNSVLSVGTTMLDGKRASFSNFGDWVTIFSPGVDIQTISLAGKPVQNSGTSYSVAIVTGVAALMKSINPKLTPKQIQNILKETAEPFADNQLNLNAIEAIRAVQQLNP